MDLITILIITAAVVALLLLVLLLAVYCCCCRRRRRRDKPDKGAVKRYVTFFLTFPRRLLLSFSSYSLLYTSAGISFRNFSPFVTC